MSDAPKQSTGFARGESGAADFTAMRFMLEQFLARVETATLVTVVAVAPGGVGPVGSVTVRGMIKQIDGQGRTSDPATIPSVPYLRLQGGANAVILDPKVGDTGICLFASRDISSVKANKAESTPGSYRRFDLSDGLYLGGVLNGTPLQYVQFADDGIRIHTPGKLYLEGDIVHTGTITSNGVNIGSTHVHSDPQGGNTGGPH